MSLASCCSTDSERPHRRCHLPNNFGSRRIFPTLHNGPEDALYPKIAPSLGYPGVHLIHVFLGLTFHIPNGIPTGSAVVAERMVVINRHSDTQRETDHATSETTGRLLLCGTA